MGTPDPQPTQGEDSRRRNERRPVSMRGNLVLEDGVRHIIELIDLNYGGCGVRNSGRASARRVRQADRARSRLDSGRGSLVQ